MLWSCSCSRSRSCSRSPSCFCVAVPHGLLCIALCLLLVLVSPVPTVIRIITPIESFRVESYSHSIKKPLPLHLSSTSVSAPRTRTLLSAHQLTTALEYLWEERIANSNDDDDDEKKNHDNYQSITFVDIVDDTIRTTTGTMVAANNENVIERLPLYPLSEVYLPSSGTGTGINYTLNNVEPQNIQMALDILAESDSDTEESLSSSSSSSSLLPPHCFCTALRSIDTGRVATIGNILRIIHTETTHKYVAGSSSNDYDDDDDTANDPANIARIRLTCQSEGLAEIIQIENGSGWKENRLRRSNEYLWAKVQMLDSDSDNDIDHDDDKKDDEEESSSSNISSSSKREKQQQHCWQEIYTTIRDDLHTIKLMYQLELGATDFPPGMLVRLGNHIQDFPTVEELLTTKNRSDASSDILWMVAQEWQSICQTLRQGEQTILAANRNEKMVAAASAQGGMLQLPIHIEDIIDPNARWEIQQLDKDAQDIHEHSGMDPILDFQVLLGLPTTLQQFQFLAQLISRERHYLEEIASSSTTNTWSSRYRY